MSKRQTFSAALLAAMLIGGCSSSEPEPEPEPTAVSTVEGETIFLIGTVALEAENVVHDDDGCRPDYAPMIRYFRSMEDDQTLFKDAEGKVVGVAKFQVLTSGESCTWAIHAEVPFESDFYYAEFAGLTTALASATEAEDDTLRLDFITPLTALVGG